MCYHFQRVDPGWGRPDWRCWFSVPQRVWLGPLDFTDTLSKYKHTLTYTQAHTHAHSLCSLPGACSQKPCGKCAITPRFPRQWNLSWFGNCNSLHVRRVSEVSSMWSLVFWHNSPSSYFARSFLEAPTQPGEDPQQSITSLWFLFVFSKIVHRFVHFLTVCTHYL